MKTWLAKYKSLPLYTGIDGTEFERLQRMRREYDVVVHLSDRALEVLSEVAR